MPLLYVDRSRYKEGLGHCMMKRFLGYHAYGTGIQHVGTTVPLATGTYVHLPIEHIAKYCQKIQQEEPEIVPIDIYNSVINSGTVRKSIEEAINLYIKEVDETGLKDLTEFPEDVDNQVTEQCSLVGGLTWVWVKKCLPWVLESYDIVAVEQEFEYVIACTCGLEDIGEVNDHEARGCCGVVLMTRPDLILRHKMTGQLVYVELKTGADVKNYNYAMQYEDNVQFALGAVAASKVLGEEVSELYVHALHKGKRDREYNQTTKEYTGPKRQNSPFCYAFYKEAQPPMLPDDLRPGYWNPDPLTGGRWGATQKKGYNKLPTWDIPFIDKPDGMPHYEHVVNKLEALDGDELANHVKFIGPISNPEFLTDKLLIEMAAEERRWAERIDYLQDQLDAAGGNVADPDYLYALAQVIPRSWECYKYGGWCEYQTVCFQKEGWEDPIQLDKYARRTPNHPIEIQTGNWEGIDG